MLTPAGVVARTADEVGAVLQDDVRVANHLALHLKAIDLVERFSPQERDLIRGMRAPVIR